MTKRPRPDRIDVPDALDVDDGAALLLPYVEQDNLHREAADGPRLDVDRAVADLDDDVLGIDTDAGDTDASANSFGDAVGNAGQFLGNLTRATVGGFTKFGSQMGGNLVEGLADWAKEVVTDGGGADGGGDTGGDDGGDDGGRDDGGDGGDDGGDDGGGDDSDG